ncbi:hypothetical protein JR316_0011628 [Psilocybe cubensis]|uniref:Uncharacterized protein n=2 Tax=Psilocybe cubensis TaxID=181762 RepID=A0ACB8GK35_PSICU|nr:hypothetical protein JR316_0011628 [Psilocybe cubensis]KAH9476058.1 hypothetical protein JR316_0011628 [Psilocybe cubensis]
MPCGLLEVLKKCFGLQRPPYFPKQSRFQTDDDQIDDVPTFKCYTANTHKMMMQEICRDCPAIGLNTIHERTSVPVVSIAQLNLSQKESFSDSHSQNDYASRPLSIDVHLKAEYEFLSAIYKAQMYKNACIGAEATARQHFEQHQELQYLNQMLHSRSNAAKKNLLRLQLRAQEAGFTQLACSCVGNPRQTCGEEGCSVDIGDQLKSERLDVTPATHNGRGIHSRSRSI